MPSNVLIFPAPVCFYIERLFSAAKMARLKNTSSLRKRKHRLLIALFHFVAKVRQFANPRLLIKAAVAEFIGRFCVGGFFTVRRESLRRCLQAPVSFQGLFLSLPREPC